ncbi:C40 family peptidase [Catenulispora sp. NF23]|uniref:C40 family peptidase n=1 Tax=Catenulispora pinistramenti TaxID=2705254 RepID=UPI001BAABF82|nr:C40 family peptidase [Catenulispora pinistramenti]MBS2534917.1 C40 family peptidase [Catenulispora pinistramenti]
MKRRTPQSLVRALLAIAGLLLTVTGIGVSGAPRASAASAIGGPISRGEIIARAQYWVDNQPGPYDQSGWSPGPGGDHNYRRDCSGYVDMAWHLNADPATEGLWDTFTVPIDRSDLRPGDILINYTEHTFIFDHWTDANGDFLYYSFGETPVQHLTGNINAGYVDGIANGDLSARRYNQVVDDTAVAPHPYPSGRIVSARDADGRLETFAAGPDGIWHSWQNSPNGTWSNWVNEGGLPNAQLAIAPNADGRLELFAENSTELDHLWQTAPNAAWSTWAKLGGGGYRIAAGANADGRIEVFASNDTGVFHCWQTAPNSPFSDWAGVAGPADSRLQMERSSDGRLEVFALSDTTIGHLYQTAANGGWSAWENFGGGGTDLTVNHNADGRLEVFASNADGVSHKWETSATTWSDWATTNGGAATSQLSSSVAIDGRIEVFAINGSTATHIWQAAVDGNWSAWETFGTGGTAVEAAENQDGHEEVFAASSAGVYHKWQTGFSTWSDWGWVNNTAGPALS